jgi:hypothetical protein
MTVRIFIGLQSGTKRDFQPYAKASLFAVVQLELVVLAIELAEAGACIGQPYAFLNRLIAG